VVKSLLGLPEAYAGNVSVAINDWDFDIVARNAILLLAALHFDPEMATVIMIHIWYSALIPARVLQLLQDNILPLIKDVCSKIQSKPGSSLKAKTWRYSNRSLRLVLRKEQWIRLQKFFDVPDGVSADLAQKIRKSVMLAPERRDYLDRKLFTQPPA
jgi:hypothetical protein